MSECRNCGTSILHRAPQARYCSQRCRSSVTYWRNPETRRETGRRSYAKHRPKILTTLKFNRMSDDLQERKAELLQELSSTDREECLIRAQNLLDLPQDPLTRRAMTTAAVDERLAELLNV